MEVDDEFNLQLELLKVQLDFGVMLSWFFAIYSSIWSLLLFFIDTINAQGLRIIIPLIGGLTILFPTLVSDWRKKKIIELTARFNVPRSNDNVNE